MLEKKKTRIARAPPPVLSGAAPGVCVYLLSKLQAPDIHVGYGSDLPT